MIRNRSFLSIYLILLLLMVFQQKAFACSCFNAQPKELISHAELIYAGKVIKSEVGEGLIKSTFNVTELFKGNAQKIEHVTSSDSSASCGISYVVGESYVVLTGADKKVSICRGYDHYFPASSKDINDTRSLGILKALRLKQ